MLRSLIVAALALAAFSPPAEARHRSLAPPACDGTDIMHPCPSGSNFLAGIRSIRVTMTRDRSHRTARPARHRPQKDAAVIEHPQGCPWSKFCGCGASVHVFGHPVRNLFLAANWFRFPRALPAAGMVAVRKHHVFVLEQQLEGGIWLAWDANSGGHATRLHPRSIAGYAIVDPHGYPS